MLISRIKTSFNLKLLLTYLFVLLVFHTVPVDIFFVWGWHEPIAGGVTINHILQVLLFLPWMVIAWFIMYDGYPGGMPLWRYFLHALGWLFLGLAFALLSEMSQHLLPYRNFSRTDAILGCVGVAVGSISLIFNPHRLRIDVERWLTEKPDKTKKKHSKKSTDKADNDTF